MGVDYRVGTRVFVLVPWRGDPRVAVIEKIYDVGEVLHGNKVVKTAYKVHNPNTKFYVLNSDQEMRLDPLYSSSVMRAIRGE